MADEAPELPAAIRLARLIVEVLRPGTNGRGERATRAEIVERLELADETVSDEELTETLERLTDTGQVTQVRRFDSAPSRM